MLVIMKILGLNLSHNASMAVIENGKVVFCQEEQLLSRIKKTSEINLLYEKIKNSYFDVVVWCHSSSQDNNKIHYIEQDIKHKLKLNNISFTYLAYRDQHHLYHAASALFNSGFNTSYCLIMDGSGINYQGKGVELISLYYFNGTEFEIKWKVLLGNKNKIINKNIFILDTVSIGNLFAFFRTFLQVQEVGSVMGLACYEPQINYKKPVFHNKKNNYYVTNNKLIYALNDHSKNKTFMSALLQRDSELIVSDYIKKIVKVDPKANICVSGGVFQNCKINYELLKIKSNLFVDPISHDGGTSVGVAMLEAFDHKEKLHPYKNLYLGSSPDYSELDKYKTKQVSMEDIADYIIEGKLIAIFQGRAEAGPRALGNRSFLFDPRNKEARIIVNKIKGRESFRPSAGTILHEHTEDWIETRGKKETPYMSYATLIKKDKIDLINGIVHKDNSCRVQTLKKEDNVHFYNLINTFYKKTNVPVLLNTSFNLAGEPLVDSLSDAYQVLSRCDLFGIYLPEKNKLIIK